MKELFLDKSLVTNPNVTGELVLVYIALRKVMSDEVPLFSKETSVGIVSLNKMAFVLTGLCTEYDSNLLSILKQGIAELAKEDYIRIIKDLKNEYIIDFEKLYLDTEKDYFVKMFVEEIQQILLLEESIKKKMSLLKYFIVICSTFNWSKDMGKYQGKISGMSLEYFADLTGISSKTCRNENDYKKGMELYLADDSMHINRKYKKINRNRTLKKNISGIDFCARDERFVKLLYYKDTWISNYRRVIVYEDGQYKLLRGSVDRWTGEVVYTLKKERYIKYTQTYDYKKVKVTGSSLVVGTFIVNYDMMNNTRIWHLNNDVTDGYYKHLYPVTEKQYEKLTELQEESAAPLSEEVIMDVINSVEYKQDGWNPYKYRRSMCGIGYHGCNDADSESISFKKWKNMMQRCYDKNVHKKYKPEYKDKTICEEWLNYANFRIWFDEHYVPGKWQIDLDKDLLVQGNKEYSPETCVFLEHYQNTMFEHNAKDMIYENEDGTFFIGKGRKKTYATYEEAVDIICGRNKKRIENEIEKSLGKIPMCAHEAMLKWDVRAAV